MVRVLALRGLYPEVRGVHADRQVWVQVLHGPHGLQTYGTILHINYNDVTYQ